MMYDCHRHFSGSLVSLRMGSMLNSDFFFSYDLVKAALRSQYKSEEAMYVEGARRIALNLRGERSAGCALIVGFRGDSSRTLARVRSMKRGLQLVSHPPKVDLRLCLIREASGYRNLDSVDVLREVLCSLPELTMVDFCGPERDSRKAFDGDLAMVAEFAAISAERVHRGWPPLQVAMHVGEDVRLGPRLGIIQMRDAVAAGVATVAHAHWLWARPWFRQVSGSDSETRAWLLDRVLGGDVTIEVCPTSSRVLHDVVGIASDLPSNWSPSLGTDNPAMLGTTISQEATRWAAWQHGGSWSITP